MKKQKIEHHGSTVSLINAPYSHSMLISVTGQRLTIYFVIWRSSDKTWLYSIKSWSALKPKARCDLTFEHVTSAVKCMYICGTCVGKLQCRCDLVLEQVTLSFKNTLIA
jgi:hypothetical protein